MKEDTDDKPEGEKGGDIKQQHNTDKLAALAALASARRKSEEDDDKNTEKVQDGASVEETSSTNDGEGATSAAAADAKADDDKSKNNDDDTPSGEDAKEEAAAVDGTSKSDAKVSAVKDEDDKDGKAKNTPAAEDKDKETDDDLPTERFHPKRPKRQPAKFKDTDIDQQSKDESAADSKVKTSKEEGGDGKTPPIIEPQEYCKKFCHPIKKQQNKAMHAILKQGISMGESMESDDQAVVATGNQGQGGADSGRDFGGGGNMFPQDKELMLQQMQQELQQLQQRNNQVSSKMRHEMVSTGVPLRDSMSSGLASMMQYAAAQRDNRQSSRRGSNNSMFDNMSLSSFPLDAANMANSPNPFKEVINKDNFFNAMGDVYNNIGGDTGNMLNNMSDMELKQRMMRIMSESSGGGMGMMNTTLGNDYGGNFNADSMSSLGKRKFDDAPSSPSGPKKSFLHNVNV